MRVGEALADQHFRDAQNLLPVYAEQACVTVDTRHAMTNGMWSAYMTVFAAHVTQIIGASATHELLSTILQELSHDHTERPTPH